MMEIFIRLANRHTLRSYLPILTSVETITELVKKNYEIKKEDQILYYLGYQITHEKTITLVSKKIINVVNVKDITPVLRLELIFFCYSDGLIKKKGKKIMSVNNKQLIKDAFTDLFTSEVSIRLMESGRILKKIQNFQEQNVQNGTTINIVYMKKQKKQNTLSEIEKNVEDFEVLFKKKNNQINCQYTNYSKLKNDNANNLSQQEQSNLQENKIIDNEKKKNNNLENDEINTMQKNKNLSTNLLVGKKQFIEINKNYINDCQLSLSSNLQQNKQFQDQNQKQLKIDYELSSKNKTAQNYQMVIDKRKEQFLKKQKDIGHQTTKQNKSQGFIKQHNHRVQQKQNEEVQNVSFKKNSQNKQFFKIKKQETQNNINCFNQLNQITFKDNCNIGKIKQDTIIKEEQDQNLTNQYLDLKDENNEINYKISQIFKYMQKNQAQLQDELQIEINLQNQTKNIQNNQKLQIQNNQQIIKHQQDENQTENQFLTIGYLSQNGQIQHYYKWSPRTDQQKKWETIEEKKTINKHKDGRLCFTTKQLFLSYKNKVKQVCKTTKGGIVSMNHVKYYLQSKTQNNFQLIETRRSLASEKNFVLGKVQIEQSVDTNPLSRQEPYIDGSNKLFENMLRKSVKIQRKWRN